MSVSVPLLAMTYAIIQLEPGQSFVRFMITFFFKCHDQQAVLKVIFFSFLGTLNDGGGDLTDLHFGFGA